MTDESEDTGKQRSTFLAFESSSSDTTVAVNDMRKDGHGLQEYTVLLVEHDVAMVMDTCDRVVAVEFGREIVTGTPEVVRSHPRVIEAYLGQPASSEVAT